MPSTDHGLYSQINVFLARTLHANYTRQISTVFEAGSVYITVILRGLVILSLFKINYFPP